MIGNVVRNLWAAIMLGISPVASKHCYYHNYRRCLFSECSIISLSYPFSFSALWHHAGEGVHSEAAVPPAGGGEGGVHPGDSRRVEAAEAAAPEAGGGVRQGREALAAGARRHGPALPPGEHEDGRAKVPAGRQVVEQGGGVGALQPGLPVPARQGPRVPSPQLTGGACLSVTVGDFL